jgi:hypothetical protein
MIERRDNSEHPLERDSAGRHVFGGSPYHKGITPKGSNVPTHRIFTIDLTDPALPFQSPELKTLPLYYPLKYGFGGPGMQYRVVSESEIEIIYMTDPEPDPDGEAYVKVAEFPEIRFRLLPALSKSDSLTFGIATLGGRLDSAQDEPCMNQSCSSFKLADRCELLATIPPIPIEGRQDIWWEFEGAYMFFHFWYCRGCHTIITNNRCT